MDFTAIEAKLKAMGLDIPARLAEWASHINSTAVLAALIAGWIVGWIWYAVAGQVWRASLGTGSMGEYSPRRQIFGGIAQVVMTIMLGSFMQRLGYTTTTGGVHTAWLIWIGFVMTTILVNYANIGKRLTLTLIDGVHWLLVLIVMGAILGGFNDLGIGTPSARAASETSANASSSPPAATTQ
jgi:hypothetical protein